MLYLVLELIRAFIIILKNILNMMMIMIMIMIMIMKKKVSTYLQVVTH